MNTQMNTADCPILCMGDAVIRLDLEVLEQRRRRAESHEEHKRELHDWASRLEGLRLRWRTVDA